MTTMTKEKSNNQSLKDVLGAEAYLEYKSDNDAIIRKQTKIADRQVEIITQRVEDKFERRLVEETSKLDQRISTLEIKMTEGFAVLRKDISDKFDSQLKWLLAFMMTQAGLIMGMIYFLHK
jgi:predicted HNH restriction endonuclease